MALTAFENVSPGPDRRNRTEQSGDTEDPTISGTLNWHLFFALFAVLNLFLFQFVVSWPSTANVRHEVIDLYALIFSAVAIAVATVALRLSLPAAAASIKRGVVSKEFCHSVAIVILMIDLVVSSGSDFATYSVLLMYSPLILVSSLLILDAYLEQSFLRRLPPLKMLDPILSLPPLRTRTDAKRESTPVQLSLLDRAKSPFLDPRSIKAGDTFSLEAGDIVPTDAIISSGMAEVMERKLSGTAEPRYRVKGAQIYAGSEVVRGKIECRAASSAEDSVLTSFESELKASALNSEQGLIWNDSVVSVSNLLLAFVAGCAMMFLRDRGASNHQLLTVGASILLITLPARLIRVARMWPAYVIARAFLSGAFLQCSQVLKRLLGISTFALDGSLSNHPGRPEVTSLQLLDDRVNETELRSLVLAVLANSGNEIEESIVTYLLSESDELQHYFATDVRRYAGKGIYGTVQGVEISIGSEEFLIERGVYLQASEIGQAKPGEFLLHVSINEGIVASFTVAAPFELDGKRLLDYLQSRKIRTLVLSQDAKAFIAPVEGSVVEVERRLSIPQYADRLVSLTPGAFFYSRTPVPELLRGPSLKIAQFDELSWDLSKADITLFTSRLDVIQELFRLGRQADWVRWISVVSALSLTTILFVVSILQLSSPVVVALSVLCGSVLLYLAAWYLLNVSR